MKKKILLGLVLVLCCLTGCGSNSGNSKNSNDNSPPEIKMSDIDWNIKSGIIDGQRRIVFSYTNNTDYTIGDIELDFQRKASTTDDDMLKEFKLLKDTGNYSADDVKKFYITAYNHRFIKSKKSSNKVSCTINHTYWAVTDLKQYKLMEPDKATIAIIKNDKLYTFYYDFQNKEMTMDEDKSGEKIYSWSTSKIAKNLPKPKFQSVAVTYDTDDYFIFNSYGVTKSEYKEYLKRIKEKFPTMKDENDTSYTGTNDKNYELNISYNSLDQNVNCSLDTSKSTESTTEATTTTTAEKVTTTAKKKSTQTSGIRPRIKKAIDSYETVMDSYCKFMKKYNESSDTSSIMKDYADYMEKYSDAAEKFEKIKDDNLNDDELTYYTKVQVRVTKKLADVQ